MLEFACESCGTVIQVAGRQRGEDVVCPHCNFRQAVPGDAVETTAEPPRPPVAVRAPAAAAPAGPVVPRYTLVEVVGYVMMALGGLTILLALMLLADGDIAARGRLMLMVEMVVSGVVTMGVGQLFHCIRDLARNSFIR